MWDEEDKEEGKAGEAGDMDVDVAGVVQLPITCLILCMVEDMAVDAEMSALPHRPHAQVYLCPTLQTE
jgi:hypothetical protein